MPRVVVMGVSGSGKSTVAELLAAELGCPMLDADSLHSPRNIELMRSGHALGDADRTHWLAAVAARIAAAAAAQASLVVACSALKRRYRDRLRQADPALALVYLRGDPGLIRTRLAARTGHFMPASLLDSQFEALEEPGADEAPITRDVGQSAATLAASVAAALEASH